MKLTEFFEYLRAHATTQELATALTQVAVTRNLVPIPVHIAEPGLAGLRAERGSRA